MSDMDGGETTTASSEMFDGVGHAPMLQSAAADVSPDSIPAIPDYLSKTYRWAYLDARNARYLDHESVVKTILWRQHRRLEQAAFAEILPGQTVLQSACVYGNFSVALAEHIGPTGMLNIVDVADLQVKNCRRKLVHYPHVSVRHEDVLNLRNESADVACCYFLMHELPDGYKEGVVKVLLESVRPGGKVVFVDYHKPHWAHPLKLVTSLVFDTLEPYAKALWHREIAEFAPIDPHFSWRKETYFGGLYQKVVAIRRI
jgi:ubiquinone/menaquinone biosynthesis C-methylase UbiE